MNCSICLEKLDKDKYLLECNHSFHTKCIMDWFRHKKEGCPLCRDEGKKDYSHFTDNLIMSGIIKGSEKCGFVVKKGIFQDEYCGKEIVKGKKYCKDHC